MIIDGQQVEVKRYKGVNFDNTSNIKRRLRLIKDNIGNRKCV